MAKHWKAPGQWANSSGRWKSLPHLSGRHRKRRPDRSQMGLVGKAGKEDQQTYQKNWNDGVMSTSLLTKVIVLIAKMACWNVKVNPGGSTGGRWQQEGFLCIVVPKNCISFLTTGFDRGVHITKQDETEKHFKPRNAPIVFAAIIFGNIWGPSTRSKPWHHSSCVIGAL